MTKKLENRIPEFRARHRLTQKQLAEKCSVSRQTIISIEKSRYTPSLTLAFEIANCLETSIDELFLYGDEEER